MVRFGSTGLLVLALLFFFLPRVTVECSGIEVQVTGFDLALGTGFEAQGQTYSGDVEPLALFALLATLGSIGVFFRKGRKGTIARAIIGGVAAVLLLVLKFKIGSDLYSQLGGSASVRWEIGYWITLFALVGAAGISAWKLRNENRL